MGSVNDMKGSEARVVVYLNAVEATMKKKGDAKLQKATEESKEETEQALEGVNICSPPLPPRKWYLLFDHTKITTDI